MPAEHSIPWKFALGCVLLTVCTLASLLLALDHLNVVELPGCGTHSACAAAATSLWGTLPVIGLPTSFLGLAYFESILVAWVWSRGSLNKLLRWTARCGAVASILLLAALWFEGHACVYCITVHVANLIWVATIGQPSGQLSSGESSRGQALLAFVSTFALTSILLAAFDSQSNAARDAVIEELVTESLEGCQAGNHSASNANHQAIEPGRYPLRPEDAAHHLVIVSDYQCPSCRTVHAAVRRMAANRRDLAVSARHFPLCTDCNSHVTTNRHANACRAASVAEAAGMLGGANAFWKAHDWLFDVRGNFNDDELREQAKTWGLSPDELYATMRSEEVAATIEGDIEAAHQAGLKFTPMMFLDGKLIDSGPQADSAE